MSYPASRCHPVPDGELTYEISDRWVRGTVGDTTVINSRRPVLVWEPGRPVPLYAFPRNDIRADLLHAGTETPPVSHLASAPGTT